MNTKKQLPLGFLDRESLEHVTEFVKHFHETYPDLADDAERKMLDETLKGLTHIANCLSDYDDEDEDGLRMERLPSRD